VLGHPEWRDDPRFATNSARMQHLDALTAAMNTVLIAKTKAEWITAFDSAGVPVGPVHTIGEALAHPQTLARGMVVDLVDPQAGTHEGAWLSDSLFCDADTGNATRTDAWRTHPRSAGRIWVRRCGDRYVCR
jgi:crotonobetainyl-CoA:carnitine CoA-transferase CaiB-like acyl-CoA transferase